MESTIKFRNIEWAISIGHTDKEGHLNARVGAIPHFHIQMKVAGRIFIKFNDFHIPFSNSDLFWLELQKQGGDKVKIDQSYGIGPAAIEDETSLKILDELLTTSSDPAKAQFKRDTLVIAPEGKNISGELILKAIEESKKTKKPVGKIMQEYLSDGQIISVISPSDNIPQMTKRSSKK